MKLLQMDFDPEIANLHLGDAEDQAVDFLGLPLYTHFFYYRKSRRRDYYFTYMLFSTAIFFILNQLQNMKIEVGIALGLFGIFSMIRYRTEQLRIREMTYLFVLIAISIINGAGMATSYASFLAVNVIFILLIAVLEAVGMFNRKGEIVG